MYLREDVKGKPRRERISCPTCGNIVENLDSKYCSLRCHLESQHRRYIERWLAGEIHGGRREGCVSNHVRRWLYQRAGSKCERCGWSHVHPITGLIPLSVNHIDGDSENHRPENLELLCGACHTLTPNYGNLNKGRGRKQRLAKLRQQTSGM